MPAENMRREGFELSVSPPQVVFKGQGSDRQEPVEEVVCEVEDQYTGPLIEAMSARKVHVHRTITLCGCTADHGAGVQVWQGA